MNTSKSLDEILRDYGFEIDGNPDGEKEQVSKAKAKQAIVEAVEGLIIGQMQTLCYFDQEDDEHKERGVLIPVKPLLEAIKEWQK